jgi:nitrite reductase (NADH) large subunit
MEKTKYLIVGGGPGGFASAEAIRKKDKQGTILMVDDQGEGLYSKVVLHKFLEGEIDQKTLVLKGDSWFTDNKVDRLKARISSFDHKLKQAVTDAGLRISFGKMLISTGGSPRKLGVEGEDLQGVRSFYSLDDAKAIKEDLVSATDVAVIGGGFLTIDLLDSLSKMGKKVTVIVRSDRLLKEKIGAKGSKIIEEKLRGQGIDFRFSANVKRFEGEGKLNKLLLDTGETLDCQLAIVAVGIVPNVDFAKSSGVEIDRGIVIDQKTLTSLSDVYACGDCCQIKNKYTGEYFLPGNWYFALVSGKIAGNNMAGADEILDEMPQVTKVVSGLTLGFVGTIAEEYIDQEYSKDGRYLQFYKKNNITIGISSINLADRMARMKEVIGKKSIFDL